MTLAELELIAWQASGDGVMVGVTHDEAKGEALVIVRIKASKTGEALQTRRPFKDEDLRLRQDIDTQVRLIIAEMVGALAQAEMAARLQVHRSNAERPRIVTQ